MKRTMLVIFGALGFLLPADIARAAASDDTVFAIKKCIEQHRRPDAILGPGTLTPVYHCDGVTARVVKLIQDIDTDAVIGRVFAPRQGQPQRQLTSELHCDDNRDWCVVKVTEPR